ncbi:metallophosphatase family protein [Marinilongibacter aquaticus]|uniref:metallophosphoesterase family protein n=1 Tax=Marinilongibacter aquaticus TaxID=2975157 RepID=UPI0021BDAC57|nr:metallophosphoesterase family protein [Marinilongibacter aquaticus]UBM58460.1 metallophosphatase family protein [Marinilongibacter aquaticus]
MQKIGLISDTHAYLDPQVFEHFKDCNQVWHLGDVGDESILEALQDFKPLKAVYGNIDSQELRHQLPEFEIVALEGLRFLLIHIAGKAPRYTKQVKAILSEQPCDVLICGHSHIVKVQKDKSTPLVYINPGAAGKQGFHHERHLMKMTVENKKITNLDLITLGKR